MKRQNNTISNVFIIFTLIVVAFAIWKLANHSAVRLSAWDWPFIFLFLMAAFLMSLLVMKFKLKPNVALIFASTAIATLTGGFVLKQSGLDPYAMYETAFIRERVEKTVIPVRNTEWESPRPPDMRDPATIFTELQEAGSNPVYMYNSMRFLPLIHFDTMPPFLPLSSESNRLTLLCQEGDQREYPVIHTDRYGFNNDDTVYAHGSGQILIVGDSFAQGQCVHQEQTVAGVLRRNGYPALSIGIGGHGPILELASIKEYGDVLKPRIVLWLYFDGNDIVDLRNMELRSSFLLQYLSDDFSQNLATRQKDVDTFWQSGAWKQPLGAYKADKTLQAAWAEMLKDPNNMSLVRRDLGVEVPTLSDDDDLVQIFEAVLDKAKKRVAKWGGKMYFVVIPNMEDYLGRIPPFRLAAIGAARNVGLPVIDIDKVLRATGNPLNFFPLPGQWGHFNPSGYALMTRQIIEAMERDAVTQSTFVTVPQAQGIPAADVTQ